MKEVEIKVKGHTYEDIKNALDNIVQRLIWDEDCGVEKPGGGNYSFVSKGQWAG